MNGERKFHVRGFERVLVFHNRHCLLQRFGFVKLHNGGFPVLPILGTLGPRQQGALVHAVDGRIRGSDYNGNFVNNYIDLRARIIYAIKPQARQLCQCLFGLVYIAKMNYASRESFSSVEIRWDWRQLLVNKDSLWPTMGTAHVSMHPSLRVMILLIGWAQVSCIRIGNAFLY